MNNSHRTLNQCAAEVLAKAFIEVLPGAFLVDSATHEFGFYYDFIAGRPVDSYVLTLLEEKMRGFIKDDIEIRTVEMMRGNASNLFHHQNQPIRAERIDTMRENIVPIIQIGDFYDYCVSPYLSSTRDIQTIKLLEIETINSTSPNDDCPVITRIHGVAFDDLENSKKYIKAHNAGKKRDHRILGQKLGLYTFTNTVSQYNPIWLSKGTKLRDGLLDWWKSQHKEQGFEIISTPSIVKKNLLQKSLPDHPNDTFFIDEIEYAIPTSFGPSHAELFQSCKFRQNKLPIRYAECAQLAQPNHSTALWGLLNEKFSSRDEAHIFCRPADIESEVISFLQFINKTTKIFNFGCHWTIVGLGKKTTKTPSGWKSGLEYFGNAFRNLGIEYTTHLESGAYTKLAAQAYWVDSCGREWIGPYIAIDFSIPEQLKLCYYEDDKKNRTPVMLVRSLFGSIERFIAILVEHYSGSLPSWLAPEHIGR